MTKGERDRKKKREIKTVDRQAEIQTNRSRREREAQGRQRVIAVIRLESLMLK